MMEVTKTICAAVLLTTIAWTSIAEANETAAPVGSYTGGGYRVILQSNGEYIGYDRQGRKLVIPASQQIQNEGKIVGWTNKHYTYSITGIGKPEEDTLDAYRKVRLSIFNAQGRKILDLVMKRTNEV